MKKIVLIFCFLYYLPAGATECVDRYLKESNININLCQNFTNYNEARVLLYKARIKVLNGYILEKVKQGLLLDNTFEIQILDAELTFKQLELSKNKTKYFIIVSGFANIKELKTYIDYFTKQPYKPFSTIGLYDPKYAVTIDKQLKKFLIANPPVEDSAITQKEFDVWKKGDLHLTYKADSLAYYSGATLLPVTATSSLPAKIKNRTLLFQEDKIVVLQDGNIIKQQKISTPIDGDYNIYVHNGTVLICDGGEENWVYKYQYAENKFYSK